MRILILALPFMGVEQIGSAISVSKGSNFISDPMNLDIYGSFIRHYYHNGDEIVYQEGATDRPYIFGNEVADNTVMTHYVGINSLPNLLNESDFIDKLSEKFDKVVAFKSNNLETHWKRWCTAKSKYTIDNTQHRHFLKQHIGFDIYQDSYYDQEIVDKMVSANDTLNAYINRTGIKSVLVQDIARQTAEEEGIDTEVLTNKMTALDIGLGPIGILDGKGNVYCEKLWSVLRGGITQY